MNNNGENKKINVLLIIEIVLGLVIILFVTGFLIYYFCPLKSVKVQGTDLYTDKEITGYILDDKFSTNTVYVFVKNKLLPKHSAEFVESFDVDMTGRNSITITVNEKTILGYLQKVDSEYVYFNYDGKIAEISPTYVDGYMEVSGLTCEKAKIGDLLSIGEGEVGNLTTLIKYIKKNNIIPNIIAYDKNNYITLCYDDYKISLGNSSYLEEKLERLSYILPQIKGMSGTLHLENFSPTNTDIVFEEEKQREE